MASTHHQHQHHCTTRRSSITRFCHHFVSRQHQVSPKVCSFNRSANTVLTKHSSAYHVCFAARLQNSTTWWIIFFDGRCYSRVLSSLSHLPSLLFPLSFFKPNAHTFTPPASNSVCVCVLVLLLCSTVAELCNSKTIVNHFF